MNLSSSDMKISLLERIKASKFYLWLIIVVDLPAPDVDCSRGPTAVSSRLMPISSTWTLAYWLSLLDHDTSLDGYSRHRETLVCTAHNFEFCPIDAQRVQSPPSTVWARESQWGLRQDVLLAYFLDIFGKYVGWMLKSWYGYDEFIPNFLLLTGKSNSVITVGVVIDDIYIQQVLALFGNFYLVHVGHKWFSITLRWIHFQWCYVHIQVSIDHRIRFWLDSVSRLVRAFVVAIEYFSNFRSISAFSNLSAVPV